MFLAYCHFPKCRSSIFYILTWRVVVLKKTGRQCYMTLLVFNSEQMSWVLCSCQAFQPSLIFWGKVRNLLKLGHVTVTITNTKTFWNNCLGRTLAYFVWLFMKKKKVFQHCHQRSTRISMTQVQIRAEIF